jgi:voltage-gated sodium channel
VSSFAVLNMFIAVVVNGMDRGMTEELVEAEEKHAAEQKASDELLLTEIRALRSEIAELRAERTPER